MVCAPSPAAAVPLSGSKGQALCYPRESRCAGLLGACPQLPSALPSGISPWSSTTGWIYIRLQKQTGLVCSQWGWCERLGTGQ